LLENSLCSFFDAAGNEDTEVTDGLMNSIDDGFSVSPDIVDIAVEIENPA